MQFLKTKQVLHTLTKYDKDTKLSIIHIKFENTHTHTQLFFKEDYTHTFTHNFFLKKISNASYYYSESHSEMKTRSTILIRFLMRKHFQKQAADLPHRSHNKDT